MIPVEANKTTNVVRNILCSNIGCRHVEGASNCFFGLMPLRFQATVSSSVLAIAPPHDFPLYQPDGEDISTRKTSMNHTPGLHQRRSDVGAVLAHHESVDDAQSLASIDRPPGRDEGLPASKIYHPLSLPVLALLMPASIIGVLARLGLQALVRYDGQSIFPLAYVQATGCFVMGLGLGMKEAFGNLFVLASVWLALPLMHGVAMDRYIPP
jgi:hypothetical protein